jgi:DNA polymerase-1
VFDAAGEKYPLTDKGNPSFAAEVLEGMESPVASIINQIRHHEKRAGTYYSSFLHYADRSNVIHQDMRQAGTETGRFSYRDPNLQNVPKEDEEEDQATPFHVRESFIPRPGHFYYSIDYKQMEYRMMLDYAGEMKLIAAVMDGMDVHQATAELVGILRKHAKTLNFAILYGAGVDKIAKMLGMSKKEALELKMLYFEKLPRVHQFMRRVTKQGESRGFIFNWMGRRCHIAQRDWAYILPNHLIQGGCADVVKAAMNRIDDYLETFQTKMLLQVHDELLLETPFNESELALPIKMIMERIYEPQNGMILEASVEHSLKSWGFRHKQKGFYGQDQAANS